MSETLNETVKNNWFPVLLGFGGALAGLHISGAMPIDVTWEFFENAGERTVEGIKYILDIGNQPHEVALEGIGSLPPDEVDDFLTWDRMNDLQAASDELANELSVPQR
ncbi:hypothetical protein GF362_01570 [Candidatus Dojkabacteria bacterium]|nr:hypothetical protein [Candidatus Dojkabacteria bacterium]